MDAHENCQRRACIILSPEICPNAGENAIANARRYCGQFGQSCWNGPNSKAISSRLVATNWYVLKFIISFSFVFGVRCHQIGKFSFDTGHMRPSSPLLDSVRDQFEDYDQLAKDFTKVFLNEEPSCLQHAQLFDIVFLVGQSKQKTRLIGVRAILAVRSRVFQVCVNNAIWISWEFSIINWTLSMVSYRKCCMAFSLDLDHRKFPLPSCWPDQHRN